MMKPRPTQKVVAGLFWKNMLCLFTFVIEDCFHEVFSLMENTTSPVLIAKKSVLVKHME